MEAEPIDRLGPSITAVACFCSVQVPLMALTATATPAVRRDICHSLKLHNPLVTCTSFDRYFRICHGPNSVLKVCMHSSACSFALRLLLLFTMECTCSLLPSHKVGGVSLMSMHTTVKHCPLACMTFHLCVCVCSC